MVAHGCAYCGTHSGPHRSTNTSAYRHADIETNRCADSCTYYRANGQAHSYADGCAFGCTHGCAHSGTDASSMRRRLARMP